MKRISTTLVAIGLFLTNSMAGELFVKVNQAGSFYATYGTQVQYNQTGIFRFFELPESNGQLVIQNQTTGQTIVNTAVYVPFSQRKIGEIGHKGQFKLIQTENLNYVNWYSTYSHPNVNNVYPPQPINNGWNGISDADFQLFLEQIKNESFDNSRFNSAKILVKNNRISATQIKQIAETFSFDSYRLQWAKYAYDYCWNQGSYFVLKPTFTFSSNYNDLLNYIDKH